MKVTVHRAQQAVAEQQVPPLEIVAVDPAPDFKTLDDARRFFEDEGGQVVRALTASLPQGTTDQILVALLKHRASLFVVTAYDPLQQARQDRPGRATYGQVIELASRVVFPFGFWAAIFFFGLALQFGLVAMAMTFGYAGDVMTLRIWHILLAGIVCIALGLFALLRMGEGK